MTAAEPLQFQVTYSLRQHLEEAAEALGLPLAALVLGAAENRASEIAADDQAAGAR
jgi:uncharacterized protein (DUF1778 family)